MKAAAVLRLARHGRKGTTGRLRTWRQRKGSRRTRESTNTTIIFIYEMKVDISYDDFTHAIYWNEPPLAMATSAAWLLPSLRCNSRSAKLLARVKLFLNILELRTEPVSFATIS